MTHLLAIIGFSALAWWLAKSSKVKEKRVKPENNSRPRKAVIIDTSTERESYIKRKGL